MSVDLSGRPLAATSRDRPLFVDREEELALAQASLRRRSNVLVTGKRGTGKTSFLHQLELRERSRAETAVFIDAASAETLADLVALIRRHLARTFLSSPSPVTEPLTLRPPEDDVLSLLGDLAEFQFGERQIVLLLDDIPSPEIGHTLFGRLRDEVWNLPFVWVVGVDENHRAAYLRPPADAFFGTVITIGPLSLDAVENLLRLRTAGEFSDADVAGLASMSKGSPRALIDLARRVLVQRASVDELIAAQRRKEIALANVSPSARRLYEIVEERGAMSASDHDVLGELDWTRVRATQVLNELEEAGLLSSAVEKGGRRKIYHATDR